MASSLAPRLGPRPGRRRTPSNPGKPPQPGGRAQVLLRLEREHVALLLAIADLEAGARGSETPALRAALLPMLRYDLARASYALRRVAAGQFGLCDRCGRPLVARLLELNPTTTRCPACAARARQGHGAA